MPKKSEIRSLKLKEKEWDKSLDEWHKLCAKRWKKIRKMIDLIFNWYFFYKPEDKGDKALHIINWIFVNIIIARIFNWI